MKKLALLLLLVPTLAYGYSGDIAIWYYIDGSYQLQNVAGDWYSCQYKALDKAKPDKRIEVQLGPGIFYVDSTLWVHGNTTIRGSGIGKTIIRRRNWNTSLTQYFGDIINSAPYGKHEPNNILSGNSPRDSLENIVIQDLTIDGNYSAFDPNSNPNTSNHFGMQIWYTDGVTLKNVQVINTFQTGIEIDACRNVIIDGCETKNTGRQIQLGTRNGINLNNNSGNLVLSSIWGRNLSITNTRIINARGANIDCANVSDVTISNIIMKNEYDPISLQGPPGQDANFGFEFEGSIPGYVMQNFTIDGVVARGLTHRFFTKGGTGPALDGLKMNNVDFTASDSSFSGAIAIGSSAGGVRNIKITNCTFRNLNGRHVDGTLPFGTAAFFYCYRSGANTDTIRDVTLSNVTFIGVNADGPAYSSNRGMQIGSNVYNFTAENVTIRNAEDVGVFVVSDYVNVSREITFKNVFVDGAQKDGFAISQSGVTGSVNGVRFINCIAKDTNKFAPGYAFSINNSTSGTVIKNTRIEGCKIIRTSGTNMGGLNLSQSNGGVIDSVYVLNNEFQNAAGPNYNTSGGVTHIFRAEINEGPFSGGGGGGGGGAFGDSLENNVWIWWKNSGGQYQPVIKVDSTNTLRFQPLNGSNLDFYTAAGNLGARWSSNGDWNVTNNGRYQLNGFRILADSSNVRKIYPKSNSTVGAIAIRDSADTKDIVRILVNPSTAYIDSLVVKKRAVFQDSARVDGTFRAQDVITARLGAPGIGAIRIIDGLTYPQNATGIGLAAAEFGGAGGIVYCPKGQYLFATFATIPGGVTILGSGDSTVFVNAAGADVFRASAPGVQFRNFRIDGQNGVFTAGRGINILSGANGCIVDNVSVINSCDASIAAASVTNISITNCRIYSPGDAGSAEGVGILIGSVTFSKIKDNYIFNPKNEGILATGAGGSSQYNNIVNNIIQTGRSTGIKIDGKGYIISTNNVNDVDGDGIRIGPTAADSISVMNNLISRCNLNGIRGESIRGGIWSGNSISNCAGAGILVSNQSGNTTGLLISNNSALSNTGTGISIDPSTTRTFTDITIANNQLLNNGGGVTLANTSFASTINIFGNVSEDAENLPSSNWVYLRKALAPVYGEATLDFDLTVDTFQDLSITVVGARADDPVSLGIPTASLNGQVIYQARCDAANSITVRATRLCGTTPNPTPGVFKVVAW